MGGSPGHTTTASSSGSGLPASGLSVADVHTTVLELRRCGHLQALARPTGCSAVHAARPPQLLVDDLSPELMLPVAQMQAETGRNPVASAGSRPPLGAPGAAEDAGLQRRQHLYLSGLQAVPEGRRPCLERS